MRTDCHRSFSEPTPLPRPVDIDLKSTASTLSTSVWDRRAVVEELEGIGYFHETDLFAVEVRTTRGNFAVGVRPGMDPFMITNANLQNGYGASPTFLLGDNKINFPTILRRTPHGEYMFRWGAITADFNGLPRSSLGLFGDRRLQVIGAQVDRPITDFGRAEARINPGDTLLLTDALEDPRGILVDDDQNHPMHMLWKYDARGYRAPVWREPRTDLEYPTGIGYSPDLDMLCIADHGAGRLLVLKTLFVDDGDAPTFHAASGEVSGIVDCDFDENFVYVLADEEPHLIRYDLATNSTEILQDRSVGRDPYQISVVNGDIEIADRDTGPRGLLTDGREMWLMPGYQLVVDGQTVGIFDDFLFSRMPDDEPPEDLPVELHQRADGTDRRFGQAGVRRRSGRPFG